MKKYFYLGFITIFWFILPFVFMWVGIESYSRLEISELIQIDEVNITNAGYIVWNWLGFFFRVLTFSLPGAPLVIRLFLFSLIPLTVLAFISVVRGD